MNSAWAGDQHADPRKTHEAPADARYRVQAFAPRAEMVGSFLGARGTNAGLKRGIRTEAPEEVALYRSGSPQPIRLPLPNPDATILDLFVNLGKKHPSLASVILTWLDHLPDRVFIANGSYLVTASDAARTPVSSPLTILGSIAGSSRKKDEPAEGPSDPEKDALDIRALLRRVLQGRLPTPEQVAADLVSGRRKAVWPSTFSLAVYRALPQAAVRAGFKTEAEMAGAVDRITLDAVLAAAGVRSARARDAFASLCGRGDSRSLRPAAVTSESVHAFEKKLRRSQRLREQAVAATGFANQVWSELNAYLDFGQDTESARFLKDLRDELARLVLRMDPGLWEDLRTDFEPVRLEDRLAAALEKGREDDLLPEFRQYLATTQFAEVGMPEMFVRLVKPKGAYLERLRAFAEKLGQPNLVENFLREHRSMVLNRDLQPVLDEILVIAAGAGRPLRPEDFKALSVAARGAVLGHLDQFRDSQEPYFYHPLGVVKILVERFRMVDPMILMLAFMHDMREDQPLKEQQFQIFNRLGLGFTKGPDQTKLFALGMRMLTFEKGSGRSAQEIRYWDGLLAPWSVYADDPYFRTHPGAKDDPAFLEFVRGVQLIKLADRIYNWRDFRGVLEPGGRELDEHARTRPGRTFQKTIEFMIPYFVNSPHSRLNARDLEVFYEDQMGTLFHFAALDGALLNPAGEGLRQAAVLAISGLMTAVGDALELHGSPMLQHIWYRLADQAQALSERPKRSA